MKGLLQEFKNCVINIVEYLLRGGLHKNLQDIHQTFLNDVLREKLDDSKWAKVLYKLTKLLHTLYGREVIVLIDDYDSPLSHAAPHGYFSEVHPKPEINVM
jgi:hypothetical protein